MHISERLRIKATKVVQKFATKTYTFSKNVSSSYDAVSGDVSNVPDTPIECLAIIVDIKEEQSKGPYGYSTGTIIVDGASINYTEFKCGDSISGGTANYKINEVGTDTYNATYSFGVVLDDG